MDKLQTEINELYLKRIDLNREIESLEATVQAKIMERRYTTQLITFLETKLEIERQKQNYEN